MTAFSNEVPPQNENVRNKMLHFSLAVSPGQNLNRRLLWGPWALSEISLTIPYVQRDNISSKCNRLCTEDPIFFQPLLHSKDMVTLL